MKDGQQILIRRKLDLRVFPREVFVYFVDTGFEIDGFQIDAQTPGYTTSSGSVYLWIGSDKGVWVHEIIHITDVIFSSLDSHSMSLFSSTEVRAYLGEWLFNEIVSIKKTNQPKQSRRQYGKKNQTTQPRRHHGKTKH